jgi:hypothetical protein
MVTLPPVRAILPFVAAVLLTACGSPPAAERPQPAPQCVLAASPTIIEVDEPKESEMHELFDLPDDPVWWAPAPMDEERAAYRAALVARVGEEALSPRALLSRARDLYATLPGDMAGEAKNMDLVLQGRAGQVGPISCLEWQLFRRQSRRWPMIEHPTEFGAFVLRGQGRVRVYFSSADRAGGKLRREVTDRVAADVARGFVPVAHLHNHDFMFDRKPGDRMWTTEATVNDIGGGVSPGMTDVKAYRDMREDFGLRGAWVTNGLDTGRFEAKEFDELSGRP